LLLNSSIDNNYCYTKPKSGEKHSQPEVQIISPEDSSVAFMASYNEITEQKDVMGSSRGK